MTRNNQDQEFWTYKQRENIAILETSHPRQRMVFRKVKKYTPDKGVVLEIGFGDGYLLNLLTKEFDTHGADISEENVARIQKKVGDASVVAIGTDGTLPYADNTFATFVATEVLEHLSDQELVTAVEEIHRVLIPGGYAIVTFPAEENLKRSECYCPRCGEVFHKVGHKQFWDRQKIRSTFKTFDVISIREYYNRFVGRTVMDRFLGYAMWIVQTAINYVTNFPNKIFSNRSYVVVLKKR